MPRSKWPVRDLLPKTLPALRSNSIMFAFALEIFPDEAAGAVEPCLDRRTCRFQRVRDLADCHLLEVTHQDDLPEMWRQGFQSAHQIDAQFISGYARKSRRIFDFGQALDAAHEHQSREHAETQDDFRYPAAQRGEIAHLSNPTIDNKQCLLHHLLDCR